MADEQVQEQVEEVMPTVTSGAHTGFVLDSPSEDLTSRPDDDAPPSKEKLAQQPEEQPMEAPPGAKVGLVVEEELND